MIKLVPVYIVVTIVVIFAVIHYRESKIAKFSTADQVTMQSSR